MCITFTGKVQDLSTVYSFNSIVSMLRATSRQRRLYADFGAVSPKSYTTANVLNPLYNPDTSHCYDFLFLYVLCLRICMAKSAFLNAFHNIHDIDRKSKKMPFTY